MAYTLGALYTDLSGQESLFGRSKTPAERLRQHQRALQKAQRELDRERTKLEQQEKKLVQEIKTSAKQGQMVRVCLCLLVGASTHSRTHTAPRRAHARSRRRTWCARGATSTSSTR